MMLLELLARVFARALPVVSAYSYAAYRFVIKRNLAVADFSVIVTAVSNLKDMLHFYRLSNFYIAFIHENQSFLLVLSITS